MMALLLGLAPLTHGGGPEAVELSLEQAFLIDGSEGLDLSALHIQRGRLLALSDKVDDTVFFIRRGKSVATLEKHRTFSPPTDPGGRMDWEGLTSDETGALYLASEAHGRVASLAPGARKAGWHTPSPRGTPLEDAATGLEGLAWWPGQGFFLAKEREPRGLFLWKDADSGFIPQTLPETRFPPPEGRNPDFADLHQEDQRLYALARNAEMVVELRRTAKTWSEARVWSFQKTVRDPKHAYLAERYGMAEGLTMDERRIYLVIDNNRSGRKENAKDRRATLFVFTRPRD